MNISIIDYIGNVNGGVGVLMSWLIDDQCYEFIFWFDINNEYKIYTQKDLNDKLGIKEDIHEWEYVEDFIIYINSIIPSKMKIFEEFDIKF